MILPLVFALVVNAGPELEVPDCRVKFIAQAVLASERTGVLAQVEVMEGSTVEKGKTLIKLRCDVHQAQHDFAVRQAESDVKVRQAKKAAEVAEQEYLSAIDANKRNPNAVSKIEELKLKLNAEKTKLDIETAQLELDLAHFKSEETAAELRTAQIIAPFDGTVVRVFKNVGEAVQQAEPIAEIVNVNRLRIEGYVSIADADRLRIGQPAYVIGPVPTGSTEKPVRLEGKLVFVDPAVEPVAQRVRIWAEVANPNRALRAGTVTRLYIPAE